MLPVQQTPNPDTEPFRLSVGSGAPPREVIGHRDLTISRHACPRASAPADCRANP
jgi:hypothetical protein